MAERLQFELVTPVESLVSQQADMVVVPGTEGDFGVLVGHAPLMSSLRDGTIEIYEGNNVTKRVNVKGGFAEVNPSGLIVLAEEAEEVKEA